MTEATAPESSPQITVDPQRVIQKLRTDLDEAMFQKAAYAALVDQLMEAAQNPKPDQRVTVNE